MTKELESGYEDTEVQPSVQGGDRQAGDRSGRGGGAEAHSEGAAVAGLCRAVWLLLRHF